MRTASIIVSGLSLLGWAAVATATPPKPEKRADASHVVTGKVQGVYARDRNEYRDFLVQIVVEKVEKGTGLKEGTVIHVSYFQLNPDKPQTPGSVLGHLHMPKEGERLRVFVNHRSGVYAAVYPDWADSLDQPAPKFVPVGSYRGQDDATAKRIADLFAKQKIKWVAAGSAGYTVSVPADQAKAAREVIAKAIQEEKLDVHLIK